MKAFNVSFVWHNDWNVVKNQFGARDLIIGTVITSFGAMLIRRRSRSRSASS